jgi:hypothetical protein
MIYACMRLVRKHPDVIVVFAGLVMASAPWAVWLPTRSRWIPSGVYALMRGYSEEINAACGIIFCLGCAVALSRADDPASTPEDGWTVRYGVLQSVAIQTL